MIRVRKSLLLLLFMILSPVPSFGLSLGPYTGTVIDSQTGDPVQGATVFMYWIKAVPPGFGYFEGGHLIPMNATITITGRDGKYNVPRFSADTGLQGILQNTYRIIYQPGYEADILNISHSNPDDKPIHIENRVQLKRVSPNFDHQEHHHKIMDALNLIRDFNPSHSGELKIAWEQSVKKNMIIVPELKDFLRRVEWEDRRGRPY